MNLKKKFVGFWGKENEGVRKTDIDVKNWHFLENVEVSSSTSGEGNPKVHEFLSGLISDFKIPKSGFL